MTVREQVPLLVGKTASPQLINRIVNVAISHDERIKHLDTVYVYHFGANFLVELHVVMDREITLCEAHDVSETLQAKLEQLSFVERAFVHCDYQFDGDEHRWCNRHKVNLQKFYKDQTDLVEAWNEGKKMITNLIDQAVQEEKERVWVTRLVIIAIILNFVMFAGKMAAATISHSLSVTASLVDRLQPLTTLIVALLVIFTNVLVLLKFAVDSVATIVKYFYSAKSRNIYSCVLWIGTSVKAAVGHEWWEYVDLIGGILVRSLDP
ncbi:hypothetical protein RB195_005714 [Necator americanus]|uniref:Cation efflux protein cytoplasmic domain-containing protein n=1 Tax=Necator americanus TaxID=51031 RepID=A0ABR1BP86_NECAM